MAHLGRRSLDELAAQVRSPGSERAEIAAYRLGALSDPGAVGVLVDALRMHTAYQVVEAIKSALLEHGAPAVPPLIELVDDRSAGAIARAGAAFVLGELDDQRARDALRRAAATDDDLIARRATFALGKLGDPSVTAELERLAAHESEDIADEAARALERLRASQA